MFRRIARRIIKPVASRIRGFMQAELLHEIRRDQARMEETLNGIEAMMVTLALQKTDPEV